MPLFNKKNIQILGIAIPVAVALLIGIPQKIYLGSWTKVIPHFIGIINSLTALCLIAAILAIKSKRVGLHRNLMLVSTSLGAVFLVLYILYHVSNPSTAFGGQGIIIPVYYFLLITHILLSIVVVRFVLLGLYYAINNDFVEHKRITKIGFPIWLYVSVSGVLVYILINPYYS